MRKPETQEVDVPTKVQNNDADAHEELTEGLEKCVPFVVLAHEQ